MPLIENSRREHHLVVTIYETLPDVLARLREHAGQTVSIEIPGGSPLFLTGAEFRALREVAQQRRIALSVMSDDPLRRQLAGVFSLPLAGAEGQPVASAPPPPVSRLELPPPVPNRDYATDSAASVQPQSRLQAAIDGSPRGLTDRERAIWPRGRTTSHPAPVPNRSLSPEPDDYQDRIAQKNPEAAETDAAVYAGQVRAGRISWPRRDPLRTADPLRDGRNDPLRGPGDFVRPDPVADDDADSEEPLEPAPRIAMPRPIAPVVHERRHIRPGVLLGAVAIGLVAVLIAGWLLTIFLFSSARVTVALNSGSVTASVDCQIVQPGQTGDATVVVQGQTVQLKLHYTGSVDTTGSRSVPDASASGSVTLVNPTDKAIKVAAGTELAAHNGQKYRVADDVSVPAAAGGTPGTATASVTAENPGSVGNLDAGELGGKLDSGVYFSNRDGAITGGTDQTVKTVAPVDIQNGHTQAQQQLNQMAARGESSDLPAGTSVVPSTIQMSEPTYSDNLQAGADGGALTTEATATATVLVYDDAQLREKAIAALTPLLQQQVPQGFQLSTSTIQLTSSDVTKQSADSASITVNGKADTSAVLTDELASSLARQLQGKSDKDARKILSENPGISSFEISYAPSWIPDRMPRSSGRIHIQARS